MIWLFSATGICFLFIFSYFNYKQENAEASVKAFLKNKAFRDMAIGLISVILGVTIAINFSDVLEKNENNSRMIELLRLGANEIVNYYEHNESLLSEYKDGNMPIEKVKSKVMASTKTLENILINESVMVSLSPTTYVGLSNHIYLVNQFYSKLQEVQNDDREIAVCVVVMHSSKTA